VTEVPVARFRASQGGVTARFGAAQARIVRDLVSQVAELLGVEHERYMQAGLFPIAYTLGTKFEPAWRKPVAEVLRWV
jgi:hypothetical protein